MATSRLTGNAWTDEARAASAAARAAKASSKLTSADRTTSRQPNHDTSLTERALRATKSAMDLAKVKPEWDSQGNKLPSPTLSTSKASYLSAAHKEAAEAHLAAAKNHETAARDKERWSTDTKLPQHQRDDYSAQVAGHRSAAANHIQAAIHHSEAMGQVLQAVGSKLSTNERQPMTTANAAKTQKRGSKKYTKEDFAYTPSDDPSSWKLLITNPMQVGGAIAALGKGLMGEKVQIPAKDRPGVIAKVRKAWKRFHKGKPLPKLLANASSPEGDYGDEESQLAAKSAWKAGIEASQSPDAEAKDLSVDAIRSTNDAITHPSTDKHKLAADKHSLAADAHSRSSLRSTDTRLPADGAVTAHRDAAIHHLRVAGDLSSIVDRPNPVLDQPNSRLIGEPMQRPSITDNKIDPADASKDAMDATQKADLASEKAHVYNQLDDHKAAKDLHRDARNLHRRAEKAILTKDDKTAKDKADARHHSALADYHDDKMDEHRDKMDDIKKEAPVVTDNCRLDVPRSRPSRSNDTPIVLNQMDQEALSYGREMRAREIEGYIQRLEGQLVANNAPDDRRRALVERWRRLPLQELRDLALTLPQDTVAQPSPIYVAPGQMYHRDELVDNSADNLPLPTIDYSTIAAARLKSPSHTVSA